jgi:transcriptional regulator with XRE-family HTH domain
MFLNIEAERVRCGYTTRRAFATAIGANHNTLTDWVLGRRPIPASFLIKISKITGCSADYLLEKKGA